MSVIEDPRKLTNEVVKTNYEEIIRKRIPFLQVFPKTFQVANIVETFRVKKSQRNKSITSSQLTSKNKNIEEFREQIFLHCDMNLSIFKRELKKKSNKMLLLFFIKFKFYLIKD